MNKLLSFLAGILLTIVGVVSLLSHMFVLGTFSVGIGLCLRGLLGIKNNNKSE